IYITCNILACNTQFSKKIDIRFLDDEDIDKDRHLVCSYLNLKNISTHFATPSNSPQLGINGSYLVVYNYLKAEEQYKINETVTYSTHTTSRFIKHVKELSERWDGPVSVAVFVPGYDFCSSIIQILKLRECGNHLIKRKVSWHIYWHKEFPPAIDWTKLDITPYINCSFNYMLPSRSWRYIKGLKYPINVGRNVARNASKTWFILPSDIELYPSKNLSNQFISFIGNENFTKKSNIGKLWPRVYVVPVFEVQNKIPDTKEELVAQVSRGDAIYFHRHVCSHCQKIPGLNSWLHRLGKPNEIHAFSSVKRHFPYHRWEPIFISTNNEPLYDERLSWEGLQDKMSQMHELCLRNYNLVILDRAYLVHSPGIKKKGRKTASSDTWREPFIKANSITYDIIMGELQRKLGNNYKCRKH
ncbi:Beta-1,4-glucuronyltransferase 1, partial [Armadillidium vulgare]